MSALSADDLSTKRCVPEGTAIICYDQENTDDGEWVFVPSTSVTWHNQKAEHEDNSDEGEYKATWIRSRLQTPNF